MSIVTVDIIAQAKGVLGSFLARAVYGGDSSTPFYDLASNGDAERNDDYRGSVASHPACGNCSCLRMPPSTTGRKIGIHHQSLLI